MNPLIQLLFESGVLARTPRNGPYHVGITSQLTTAAHAYRMSLLAYFIAQQEGADIGKVLQMCMIRHLPESRLLNQTFVQKTYADHQTSLPKVLTDQLRALPGSAQLLDLQKELIDASTKEAGVVEDANILSGLVEAREYMEQGIMIMEKWFNDKKGLLKTNSGKKLFDDLRKERLEWWR